MFDGGGLSERSRTRTRTRRESQRRGERKKKKEGLMGSHEALPRIESSSCWEPRICPDIEGKKKNPYAAGVVIAGLLVVPHPGLYIQYPPPPPL